MNRRASATIDAGPLAGCLANASAARETTALARSQLVRPRHADAGPTPEDLLAGLHPTERAALGRVGRVRAADFAAGRRCAHEALAALGAAPGPLLPGPDRAPRWPAGFTGSITHCDGYAAAVVAGPGTVLSVGLDAEPDEPLPPGVLDRVAGPAERAALTGWTAHRPGTAWDRVLFSAKEAVYKAWSPVTGHWLGFADATVTMDLRAGRFVAHLRPGAGGPEGFPAAFPSSFTGSFAVRAGVIVTLVVHPGPVAR